MSQLTMFILALTLPLAIFAYALNKALIHDQDRPDLGIVAFISLFMINPPNS